MQIEKYLNKIHCMDCLDFMAKLPSQSVDIILTDPPYNAGREYANDNLSKFEYENFTIKYLSEAKRILKENSNIIIIIGIKYLKTIFLSLSKYFNYNWQFVLHKSNGMLNGKASFSKWDSVLWFSNGCGFHNRQLQGTFSIDVWNLPINPIKNKNGHPTPKDEYLMRGILELFSNKNDIVFDPFIGSGTTAIACERLGRRWLGCEISQKYVDIANARIEAERRQLKLPI